MHQRKSEFGRPSGTDGSDFSYRMVVDSRYQKVAKKKKILSSIIGIQVIFQLVGLSYILLSVSKGESPDALAISSALVSLISLIIGELGRRRSRVNLLRIYMVGSSVAMILSMFGVIGSKLTLEVIENPSNIQGTFCFAVGLLVHIFAISTVISLISNMSPPKRAS